ncbi:MAG: hypothetical protein Q7U36_02705 [bacterium]|nr:hypothetical protein [bacterium]
MYTPIWVLILAIIGVFFYFKKRNTEEGSEEDNFSPEENWTRAEWYKANVMRKSPNLENHLKDERDMIGAMELDMIRLRERYKHDPKKQSEIAKDWFNFARSVDKVKSASEMLDVDAEDDAFESFINKTKEPHTIIQEIAKRVEKLLGDEAKIMTVRERIEKQQQIANNILKEESDKEKK